MRYLCVHLIKFCRHGERNNYALIVLLPLIYSLYYGDALYGNEEVLSLTVLLTDL